MRVHATSALILSFALCGLAQAQTEDKTQPPAQSPPTDATTSASQPAAGADWASKELPVRKIPNIPESAEAYYAPDSYHVIAQTQDPKALKAKDERSAGGALTWIYTDDGAKSWPVNDRGQDACSWFFPDGKRIVWTSTKDHMSLPVGDWSNDEDYPKGAELYVSDWQGKNIQRLTNNENYEAEVTVSPDGKWIVFGRNIDGKMDIWRMKSDGTQEKQLTATPDWQEGAPYFLPDNQTIIFRAWKRSETKEIKRIREETGQRLQTPMTIFTMKLDGSDVQPRTFTKDMNWAPFPAPDGRHFVYVRVADGNNWDVFLNDLAGGEPRRLTFKPGFDGFPAISPDGKKMLFARSTGGGFMSGLYTHVMDISSLNLGPENYKGVPPKATPPASAASR